MSKPLTSRLTSASTSLLLISAITLWGWSTSTLADTARIVTLTPHATEMVFAAGAGDQIVGTVNASDFPALAKSIERVGDGLNTSVEQVLALQPDWVIGWPSPLLSQLKSLGLNTITSTPDSLEAIGHEVVWLGELFQTTPAALAWHQQFTQTIAKLQDGSASSHEPPVVMVILASDDAQFVIGHHLLINDALARCGATNPFATTAIPAPKVSREGLIAAKPNVIISGRALSSLQDMTPDVTLGVIDADALYRPGPRFIDAALEICKLAHLERQNRTK